MEGGVNFEGLHHLGFKVDNLEETNAQIASTDAKKLGTAGGTGHEFYFEEKFRGPNGVIMDVFTKGWDLSPPATANTPASDRKAF